MALLELRDRLVCRVLQEPKVSPGLEDLQESLAPQDLKVSPVQQVELPELLASRDLRGIPDLRV